MGILIAVESFETLPAAEIWPLLEDHREELTTNKALMVLAPDMERYILCERMGAFFALMARDNGVLVGYSGNFIAQNLHYKGFRYANNDVLFLAKTHRKGSLGLRMIRETEKEAQRRGAQMMVWHAKPKTSLDAIMPKLSYRVQDVMYSKTLE